MFAFDPKNPKNKDEARRPEEIGTADFIFNNDNLDQFNEIFNYSSYSIIVTAYTSRSCLRIVLEKYLAYSNGI